ncbi:MAG: AAA family ATPase, partial [Planctomycetes bacterium]|nr:AAA family ATPase [Planctomycetota bacterium]
MRILRLDLLAFGPFAEKSLEFTPDTGLHLVHGPNEAGKSSALRALRNWLYGIPQQTTDNFRHPHPDLRVGGLLQAGDGTTLEFIRRKGRTKTLRGRDDVAVFDEARLVSVLGGIDETAFTQRFGID